MIIPVLHDKDGIYKIFFDKNKKCYIPPPDDLSKLSPFIEKRSFVNATHLTNSIQGEFKIIDRSLPESLSVVESLTQDDLNKFTTEEERSILKTESYIQPHDNNVIKQIISPMMHFDISKFQKQIMLKAKEILKAKSSKQATKLYDKLEGFVEGLSLVLPGDAESFNQLFKEMLE